MFKPHFGKQVKFLSQSTNFSDIFDKDINLKGLFDIISPENNLVLADDMMLSDADGISHAALQRFTQPIVAALEGLGIRAEASGRNDILAEGRKVSGTAQRVVNGRILYHGTLLFDSNPDMVAGALQVGRIFYLPLQAYKATVTISKVTYPVMEIPQLTWVIICLALSAACCLAAGVIGVHRSRTLAAYNASLNEQ